MLTFNRCKVAINSSLTAINVTGFLVTQCSLWTILYFCSNTRQQLCWYFGYFTPLAHGTSSWINEGPNTASVEITAKWSVHARQKLWSMCTVCQYVAGRLSVPDTSYLRFYAELPNRRGVSTADLGAPKGFLWTSALQTVCTSYVHTYLKLIRRCENCNVYLGSADKVRGRTLTLRYQIKCSGQTDVQREQYRSWRGVPLGKDWCGRESKSYFGEVQKGFWERYEMQSVEDDSSNA